MPVPATATTATFAARMPVIANDRLGLMSLDGAPACLINNQSISDVVNQGTTDDPPGSFTLAGSGLANERVNVSAQLEPDIDSDGFGDETQDRCPGVTGTGEWLSGPDLGANAHVASREEVQAQEAPRGGCLEEVQEKAREAQALARSLHRLGAILGSAALHGKQRFGPGGATAATVDGPTGAGSLQGETPTGAAEAAPRLVLRYVLVR